MEINFQLKDIHKLILISMYSVEARTVSDITIAVNFINETEYDYFKLLKGVVDRSRGMTGFFSDGTKGITRIFSRAAEIQLNAAASLLKKFRRNKKEFSTEQIAQEVKMLEMLGLVEDTPIYSTRKDESGKETTVVSHNELLLTDEGKRLADGIIQGRRPIIRPPKPVRSTIFIASSFGQEELDCLYDMEFKPACEEFGYKSFRVDLSEPSQTITDYILRGIQESECLIADLTYARPSVYFEIGVAHGLGMAIILTCRKDHYRGTLDNLRVHFDLEQYKISYWERANDGSFIWPKNMTPVDRLRGVIKK